MTDLVTGVAGFIGSHLAARLLSDGREVVGVDAFTDYYDPGLKRANLATVARHPGFTFVEADLAVDPLEDLVRGAECVFHLAAQPGVRGSWGPSFAPYIRNNIAATQRLLEALRGSAARLVYASSSSVYGEAEGTTSEDDLPRPVSPYGVTKLAAEHLCMLYFVNHKVPAVALRYFTVYGPHQRPDMGFHKFLKAAHHGEPITVYGDGEQTRDFTFVADAVAATRLAGERGVPGRVYNIGGGSRVSVNHVLTLIEQVVGRPVTIARESAQKGDMRDTYADTSLAAADLGFAPKTTLLDGLTAEYAWLQTMLPARV